MSILPYMDPTLVLECTGEQILAGLENGVSMYPRMEGRFPQVSGELDGRALRARTLLPDEHDPNQNTGSQNCALCLQVSALLSIPHCLQGTVL